MRRAQCQQRLHNNTGGRQCAQVVALSRAAATNSSPCLAKPPPLILARVSIERPCESHDTRRHVRDCQRENRRQKCAMSDPHDRGGTPPRAPPDSPTTRRLKDRVSFFEKVWSGSRAGTVEPSAFDVDQLERKLAEDRSKHLTHAQIEHVNLRPTPPSSPKTPFHTTKFLPDGTVEETLVERVEEGDLASGTKTVKFEKVTVRKSVKHVTTTVKKVTSRTPSEELLLEDSAYQTHSNGTFSQSKSSSTTSLGRFPSEESLRRTPSREGYRDEWDAGSSSSGKAGSSSSEWYNEYRTQSFQPHVSRHCFSSKTEYDNHIAIIRGQ